MPMLSVIINLILIAAIICIIIWFWLTQPRAKMSNQHNIPKITVKDGVYSPSSIIIQANKQPIKLLFWRKDSTPCAEWVVFPDLDKSEKLPIEEHKTVNLGHLSPGEYAFHCQMHMYQGCLVVQAHE